ncbi:hypothetical protein EJ05DRAFT_481371 [Pseudovirgaria hyperparasitica]|uniref:Cyclin N-terminal domain-containing protein n=1 Tax=Pseudovirgaria hyperparasitica TaxID=470096 RepID=A0A6A6WJM8_9PEZI|nr:uncharacterized protein EJ05DRAFT_481371 [Pseudovirgaria hyperparasitica]KAF2762430.1 hypothetical protein EJ05DRAFT_481371 [Pseudovirgaria hyperparasitica]
MMSLDLRSSCANPTSYPYASSLASSASSSSSSVFSDDARSQDSSASSTQSSQTYTDSWAKNAWNQPLARVSTFPQSQTSSVRRSNTSTNLPSLITSGLPLSVEQRQHPRRSSISSRPPPTLVRQSERKVSFVDSLVVSATQIVEVIWPLSVPACPLDERTGKGVLPLRTFIQETLRRSRTSYSTLQVALYYLILIKPHVPATDFTMEQRTDDHAWRSLQCGRRMFLAALILASKYLQDRNFSSRAWSKISGLKVCEINTNEMAFLEAVKWKLHITDAVFERWQRVVFDHTPGHPPSPGGCALFNSWRAVMPQLTPDLDKVCFAPRTSERITTSEKLPLPRSPLGFSPQEAMSTPIETKLPRFLEPKPEMLPPTPTLLRTGLLPTPLMTPQSIASSAPAASGMTFGSRRPSMCSAMAQAQSVSNARSITEWPFPTFRRPSITCSGSLSSSPESMVSDNSSRSSRASSISSVSSAGWAPNQANLARMATCRNVRLPYQVPVLRRSVSPQDAISEMPSPCPDTRYVDDDWVLKTPTRSVSAYDLGSSSRKRARESLDLHQNVREQLATPTPVTTVLPDRTVAKSFALQRNSTPAIDFESKQTQSPSSLSMHERRVPIQKDLGRKRTCASEATLFMSRQPGPGMWEDIL